MARQHAETSHALKIFWLRKQGYFPQGYNMKWGTVTWTNGEHESSISISVMVGSGIRDYIHLHYTHTNRWSGEKSDMDYNINLVTTPCRYGGVRYWFICPLTKNESYCGRRIGVLYLCGKYYGCRHCCNVAYNSQFEGGNFRVGSICEPDVEKAYKDIKREYYNGKPTRRHKRYLRLREKMNRSWMRAGAKFGMNF